MSERKYYIDQHAVVKTKRIGEESKIWQFSVVLEGAQIGNNVNINAHCFVEDDVVIGDNVTIKSGVYLWNGMEIGDNVQIGPNVAFSNDKYPRAKKVFELQRITIKEGASIGASSTVLGGTTIGKYAIVGAATLITKDVPDFALVYGSPGQLHGYVCECSQKLSFVDGRAVCPDINCGKDYQMNDGKVIIII